MTEQKLSRELSGAVVSATNNKTIVVLIKRRVKHSLLGKFISRSTKIHAHDENNICGVGDLVTIRESRPHSKMKSWELAKVVKKAQVQ